MADYSKAFSPSFASKTFTTETIPGIDYTSSSELNLSNIDFAKANSLSFDPIAFDPGLDLLGSLGGGQQPAWTFITAPEDISWTTANQANRVDIFGTNNPPVVSGSRGMRDLTLGNALVEGFVRGKQVEDKVLALESLMNYGDNLSDGFVAVPVYQVWANKKGYGNEGYFIIKDVRVKETMRDLTGNATRAYVDISLMQVPAYQVNSGRDQASAVTAGAKAGLLDAVDQANQNIPGKGSTTSPNDPAAKAAEGAKSSNQAAKPATAPSTRPKVTITASGQPEIKYVPPPR